MWKSSNKIDIYITIHLIEIKCSKHYYCCGNLDDIMLKCESISINFIKNNNLLSVY
jgi:hypothetical protein